MHVALLGPLEVRTDGDPGEIVEVAGARLRALLIMLALHPGQLVTASQLIDGLWPAEMPGAAGNALQALVSRLRRALPGAVIESRPSGYQLKIDPRCTDIVRFEDLVAAGRARLRDDPAAAGQTLRQALALWRGPALADVADTDFGQAAIARLDELRLTAIEQRVDADLRTGNTASLVAELEGLVTAHPMREPLAARLMRALHAAGRRSAALEVYERTRKRLVNQLGVEPSAELAALHLDILRDESPAEPDPKTSRLATPVSNHTSHTNTNLRAELTSFVGRDAELRQVAELLGAYRLITLTGPGGAGKTRLAVEAARAELGAMPDGVWLVELAPVTDPADVTPTVLSTLGLREQALLNGGRRTAPWPVDEQADALSRLLAALARQRTLLVLDNCEHLVAAAAALADRVLAACPQVRIVATSREPLNITGEALWTVGPLTLPPDPAVTSFSTERAVVHDSASVRLLTQRARAVVPGFEVTQDNAAAVATICRELDGMPLAIELAAARLRTMGPEQIVARLGDRFRLLSSGSRTAMPRHQTLRAVVDWSWDLLDDAERTLWRRFSVFAGGATLEAAEQVCSGSGLRADQVLDLLTALADKSLLTVRHDPPRYRMLEIIRAYGQERLAEAGESEELREAHAQYFTRLAEASQDHLLAAEQLDWLRWLADDQDNLHAAVRGAVAAGDAGTAVRLVAALGWYWWLRSMKMEGAELVAEALAVPGPRDTERLALAYMLGALLAANTPRGEDAAEWFRMGVEAGSQIPDTDNPMLRLASPVASLFGAFAMKEPLQPSVVDEVADDPHPWVRAIGRMLRGHLAVNFGGLQAEAKADFLAAADLAGTLGERWAAAVALSGLAMLEGWQGEHAAAADHYRQASQLAAELGTTEDELQFRLFLVRELWLLGEHDRARAELRQAQRDAGRLGVPEILAMAAFTAGDLARLDGEYDVARAQLTRAAELAVPRHVATQLRAVIATGLGYLAAADGDLDAARGWHAQALAAARSSFDAPVISQALVGLADLAIREGHPEQAAELLGASCGIRGTTDRSVQDEVRVADEARSVLGDTRYGEAYQRGQCVTVDTLAALITSIPGA
ncbi:MAG TPA: BTAD domain-containing putative transcriptional regulator [Streptosporangiaceae bacterium]|nr:BTAD domain-containing putative transcriptional regulator [Streptosporangiaceae bacterium]